MHTARISCFLLICAAMIGFSGCVDEQKCKDLKLQNETQSKHIAELESQMLAAELNLEKAKRELEASSGRSGTDINALNQKITALEEDIAKKKSLIAMLQQQVVSGGVALPPELNTMLEDFAKDKDLVTYDSNRGVVKFKSDLLFDAGSDRVADSAVTTLKALCDIVNSEQGRDFDIIIAGHTDDLPIAKSQTRELHPTNWHLSAHRAISVLNLMAENNVTHERMSIRGFGEYRPIAPNQDGKKGNPLNRRVEIYIVAKGV